MSTTAAHEPRDPSTPAWLSRRAVLAGGFGLVVLTACGSTGSSSAKGSGEGTDTSTDVALMAFFEQNGELTVGHAQRAVVGIGDVTGVLLEDTPATLSFTVQGEGEKPKTIEVPRHNDGLPRAYYPVVFTPSEAKTYTISTSVRGQKISTTFTVGSESPIPGPGAAMPKLVTPTTADPHGVTPICTRQPACPLHTTSLDTALTLGKPTVFLISTPAFCQVAICGPVLDVLLAVSHDYEDRVTFIHQEVYANADEAAEKGNAAQLAPALTALGLTFEPLAFLVKADGTIAERLDHIYDATELRAALDRLVA